MKIKIVVSMFTLIACIILFSCSSTRHIRPVEKGELSASATLGGPLLGSVGYIPTPMLSIGGTYGAMEKIDVEAGLEVTSALFGILQMDGGINWRPLVPAGWKPGLILGTKLLGATDFSDNGSRLWPDASVTLLWQPHPKVYCYAGIDNWFETHTTRLDGNKQPANWLPVLHTGIDYGGNRWQIQLEANWYVPNVDTRTHTVKPLRIGSHGGIGAFLGVSRSFGILGKKDNNHE